MVVSVCTAEKNLTNARFGSFESPNYRAKFVAGASGTLDVHNTSESN